MALENNESKKAGATKEFLGGAMMRHLSYMMLLFSIL